MADAGEASAGEALAGVAISRHIRLELDLSYARGRRLEERGDKASASCLAVLAATVALLRFLGEPGEVLEDSIIGIVFLAVGALLLILGAILSVLVSWPSKYSHPATDSYRGLVEDWFHKPERTVARRLAQADLAAIDMVRKVNQSKAWLLLGSLLSLVIGASFGAVALGLFMA